MTTLYAYSRAVGTASEIVPVFFEDSRGISSVGIPNISASSIAFSWCKDNQATQSSGICSSQTVVGTYSTASLMQISSTSTLGWYQFGLHNGALAAGRSCVLRLWSATSTAGVRDVNIVIDLLGNVSPVSVSSMSVPVGVSSASVNLGVSTVAVLVGVSTLSVPVGVSSYSRDPGSARLRWARN